MSNTLLVPMAGNSTRFGGELPKFLWEHEGRCMAKIASSGLEWAFAGNVYYIIRQDHFTQYTSKVVKHFKKSELCIIDSSRSQAETIYKAIKQLNITDNFAIKDCDNYFTNSSYIPYNRNYIGIGSLYDYESIQPGNKSYIQEQDDKVINIAEKKIISHQFCSGLYAFHLASEYNKVYEYLGKINLDKEINISHIILAMILLGNDFLTVGITDYVDFGTEKKWLEYVRSFRDNRI